jgi:hypothetical protein
MAGTALALLALGGTALASGMVPGTPELAEEAFLAERMADARAKVDTISVVEEGTNEPVSEGFELVGHNPLFDRGMNAALAVHGDYAYIGNRTDGQPQHRNPGILVTDVSDPANPEVVHEIGRPDAAAVGETSRELRIWPEQDLLVVLNFGCSSAIHACAAGEAMGSRVTFFDIAGEKAAAPELVSTYEPTRTPHEFFLWVDPAAPDERALIFQTTPTSSTTRPSMIVTDISGARQGEFAETPWAAEFEGGSFDNGEEEDRRLHSLGISNDGKRAYLSFLGSGFLVLDTSQVADGTPDPVIELVTPPENRAKWSNPGSHSTVKIPGKDAVLTTDEVYGDALDALGPHGCPWGWVRTLDISDETKPTVTAEYKVEENEPEYCDTPEGSDPTNTTFTSYSAHNPTLTPDLAFVSWHSAGLEAIDIKDPTDPQRAGTFKPEPLPVVGTEDPALSLGRAKVVMWSYPIIKDGLIYVVDLRNGLYILRYTGEGAEDVAEIDFLEGNSNLGDAVRLDQGELPEPGPLGAACPEGQVPDSGHTDADANTHEVAIDCMVWWEIARGASATDFDVELPVTRGQMASFVARLIEKGGGELNAEARDAFGDDNGNTHEPNIDKLAAAGIVTGTSAGRYDPGATVTRAQMATFLVNAYEHVSDQQLSSSGDSFDDDNGNTHEDNINKSAAAGFTVGRDGGYDPLADVLRDQMASFLANVLDLQVKEGTTAPHA